MATAKGYWLPGWIHQQIITESTPFQSYAFIDGKPSQPHEAGSVTAHWPLLTRRQWKQLLQLLETAHQRSPSGMEYWERLGTALRTVGKRMTQAGNPLREQILRAVPGYTGYSRAMIELTLHSLELMSLDQMAGAYTLELERLPTRDWAPMGELPGQLIYTYKRFQGRLAHRLPGHPSRSAYSERNTPEFVLGYGAGNVPGTALLIALLAGSTTLIGGPPPSVLVRNSRREPIFTPLVLGALEQVDPDLVAATALLVWDYDEGSLQQLLLEHCDLVIAAASDETIARIGGQITAASTGINLAKKIRYHEHGHKVSFSAISREVLEKGAAQEMGQPRLVDILAVLAGLDSFYWDQYGCLSSRIHFIEAGGDGYYSAADYAESLYQQLRILADALPRGSAPLRLVRDSFDRYKMLERQGGVRVVSEYQDGFLLLIDRRELEHEEFYTTVNNCTGRVIIVRPVEDLMQVPSKYLKLIPSGNLQSLSVAFRNLDSGSGDRFLRFAKACARRGVTAIRTLGRGAFPQLAYSWDGLIPLDLVSEHNGGYFSTIEFDDAYQQILDTYHQFQTERD
jgi:hypothetical protein